MNPSPGARTAPDPVTFDDVLAAARVLDGVAHRTPVLTSRHVDERTGARVFFKCENLQRAGAFKFRGAYNALSNLPPEARKAGVVAYSSGNHAQAVALAGRLLEVPAVIVMPADAPPVKIAATRGYGAEVVLYDRFSEDREAIASRLERERGVTLVPPFDHRHIIAGQGTAALELVDEVGPLDVLLVPCGGGGLVTGCAIAAHGRAPDTEVIAVEPAAGDDVRRSFKSGTIQRVVNPDTIADGARTSAPGAITFPLILKHLADVLTVEDGELLEAMWLLWERMKIVVEPTGALGAAALLANKLDAKRRRVGVVISGGNADFAHLCRLVEPR